MRHRSLLISVSVFTYLLALPLLSLAHEPGQRGLSPTRPLSGPSVETDRGFMIPYDEQIPETDISFHMVPIPGGLATLGSPADESGRNADEGPQAQVRISPMWVARCEVTWDQYHVYMGMYKPFKQLKQMRYQLSKANAKAAALNAQLSKHQALELYLQLPADVDAVTCPTPLYDSSFTYEPGQSPEQPAITMSHFAARQFTKWLSGITAREYRLPSEAEWDYFARAGTTSAYSFGNDDTLLDDYAWHAENSEGETHPVGTKQPNPWGLHDVHGNVAEWVLDQYDAKAYLAFRSKSVAQVERVIWPTQLEPRVLRGGSWLDGPSQLRSAARFQSADEDWTMSDPNLPTSPWWFTEFEATGVGMRIVRPLEPMDAKTKERVWEADVELTRLDVEDRLAEGRGAIGSATPKLPAAVSQLKAMAERP